MDDNEMWQAVQTCDPAYDGEFFYAVQTTRIFCRPSCKSKCPRRNNVEYFKSSAEAEAAGYRPCKRCRPGLPQYDPDRDLAEASKSVFDQYFTDRQELNQQLKELGVTRKQMSLAFKRYYDMKPAEYLIQVRIAAAKQALQAGASVFDAAADSGYTNYSSFYAHFRKLSGMPPAKYRQLFAQNISRAVMDTPIGPLRILASQDAILCVEPANYLEKKAGQATEQVPADRIIPDDPSGDLVKACMGELKEYFAGQRQKFDLPLLPEGTSFQQKVWQQLQQIPYGETRSYQQLAEMTGDKNASRAIGLANNCNPILILIPCHRVIGADGSLTGYAAGLAAKKLLLDLEKGGTKK
ncbi:bifunctional transcriptional activator/DNA repair enzyme AdaA [Lactobacillus delbrueckii]|uniref:bifunctional transcriptional activator/DNA repair enzyme AdaA n=1 Tax=Lactobacillus delbrueckii TaxID=1584 RepID=UPI003A85AE1D